MIYIRQIRDKQEINASFFARDGAMPLSLNFLHIGESVTLVWDISERMYQSINGLENREVRAYTGISGKSIHIKFKVVDKDTAFTEVKDGMHGDLRLLSKSVTLEAANHLWEDIWLWGCFGDEKAPSWALDPEDVEEPK